MDFAVARAKDFGIERDETEILAGIVDSGNDCGDALRLKAAIFVEQQAGAEHEVAGVPQIALLDVTLRGLRVRLLDELLDGEDLGTDGLAGADIAVFGRRPRRPHAEGNDTIRGGRVRRHAAHFGESGRIGDDVIGSKRDDQRIAVAFHRESGARRDRRP